MCAAARCMAAGTRVGYDPVARYKDSGLFAQATNAYSGDADHWHWFYSIIPALDPALLGR